ncbi:MAG: hypothetical protein ABI210_12245, partial [Abditibacteriaceae bacterium]
MRIVKILLIFLLIIVSNAAAHADLYVAPNGNDAWSGRLSVPNKNKTDGPLATLERARDVLRNQNPASGQRDAKKIIVRGGTYYLKTPLTLNAQDSGLSIA